MVSARGWQGPRLPRPGQNRLPRGRAPPDGPNPRFLSSPMKIEWSPEAAADFARTVAYIHEQNPSAADRVRIPCTILPLRSNRFPIMGGRAELLALANSFWRRFHLSSSDRKST